MPTNNRRKNPFSLAPALTFVVLALFVLAALFEVENRIGQGIITLFAFGIAFFIYIVCRGGLLLRIPNRAISGSGLWVALFSALLMIAFSAFFRFGILRDASLIAAPPKSFLEGLLSLLAVAVIPAVCEEYFFRGAVMLEYRFAGVFGSAFFSALLFAAVHLSLSLFVLYFVCGLMLSFTVFVTGDVKMAVVSHILYNLYALFAERDVYLLAYDEESRVLFLTMAGACVLLALWGLLKVSETLLRERAEDEPPVRVPRGKGFFVFYDIVSTPSLWLVAIVFLLFTLLRHFL